MIYHIKKAAHFTRFKHPVNLEGYDVKQQFIHCHWQQLPNQCHQSFFLFIITIDSFYGLNRSAVCTSSVSSTSFSIALLFNYSQLLNTAIIALLFSDWFADKLHLISVVHFILIYFALFRRLCHH